MIQVHPQSKEKAAKLFPLNEDTEPKYFKRKEKNEFFLLSPHNKVDATGASPSIDG